MYCFAWSLSCVRNMLPPGVYNQLHLLRVPLIGEVDYGLLLPHKLPISMGAKHLSWSVSGLELVCHK